MLFKWKNIKYGLGYITEARITYTESKDRYFWSDGFEINPPYSLLLLETKKINGKLICKMLLTDSGNYKMSIVIWIPKDWVKKIKDV